MTVSSASNRVSFAGNGATTAFAYPYHYLDKGDLVVVLKVNSTGAETVQTITTNYTVSPDGPIEAGGTVTMVTPPASGETLIIYRDPALTQDADYADNDPFPATTHERALDRSRMIDIRLKEQIDQTLKSPESETGIGRLPSVVDRASKWFTFDASGNPTASPAPSTAGTNIALYAVSNYATFALADAAASAVSAVLVVDVATTVSADITVASRLLFLAPGKLTPASGITITLSDEVTAGLYQIFDLSAGGDVKFGQPQTVYPEWFGTGTSAVLYALKKSAAGSVIELQGKAYTTVPLVIDNNPLATDGADTGKVIRGAVPAQRYKTTGEFYGAVLKLADGSDADVISISSSGANEYGANVIENVMIDGNKANQSAGSGIAISNVKDVMLRNVYVWNCFTHGINITGGNQIGMEGSIEVWNNGTDGIRGASLGDPQWNAAVRAQNNGRYGIYIATGRGRIEQLYAYFNGAAGVYLDSNVDDDLQIGHVWVEDNDTAGLRIKGNHVYIGSVRASDNNVDNGSSGNQAGVWLDGCSNVHIGHVSAAARTAAAHRQKYLVYDLSAGGCTVGSIDNAAYGLYAISGEQTVYVDVQTLVGVQVGPRQYKADTYANLKDAGATVTLYPDQYGRYVITDISETMTISSTAASRSPDGMTLDVTVSSSGGYNLNWASTYLDYDGTALSATALTAGQTASASFVRRGGYWHVRGAVVVA